MDGYYSGRGREGGNDNLDIIKTIIIYNII